MYASINRLYQNVNNIHAVLNFYLYLNNQIKFTIIETRIYVFQYKYIIYIWKNI